MRHQIVVLWIFETVGVFLRWRPSAPFIVLSSKNMYQVVSLRVFFSRFQSPFILNTKLCIVLNPFHLVQILMHQVIPLRAASQLLLSCITLVFRFLVHCPSMLRSCVPQGLFKAYLECSCRQRLSSSFPLRILNEGDRHISFSLPLCLGRISHREKLVLSLSSSSSKSSVIASSVSERSRLFT